MTNKIEKLRRHYAKLTVFERVQLVLAAQERADLSDIEGLKKAVAGVDVVYHLAARTTALRARDLMRVNAIGTANLTRACAAQSSPPVMIHVSSVAAAGPSRRGQCRSESDPPAPVSNYGRSKRAGELCNAQWAHAVPTTIIRPGIIFGPRKLPELGRSLGRGIAQFKRATQDVKESIETEIQETEQAVEKALRFRRCNRDVVAQYLYPEEACAVPTFSLEGREHLQGVYVAAPDLTAYVELRGGHDR